MNALRNLIVDKFRSVFQPLVSEEEEKRPIRKSFSQPGLRSFAFKKDLQEGSQRSSSFVRSFEEDAISLNLKSQLIYGHSVVQPTDIAENRTMLFTVKQDLQLLVLSHLGVWSGKHQSRCSDRWLLLL